MNRFVQGNTPAAGWHRVVALVGLLAILLGNVVSCGRAGENTPLSSAMEGGSDRERTIAVSSEDGVADDVVTIVAMGDSLTEGVGVGADETYPAQLEQRLRADGYVVEVINAGNSGETSSGALARLEWVLTLEPDILILATGGNDGLRGTETELTAQNIDQMIAALHTEDVLVVLAGMEMVQNMGEEYNSAFRALYPTLAENHNVILVPFLLAGVAADPALNQPDFIHPNADGYGVVVETIYPYVLDALAQLE